MNGSNLFITNGNVAGVALTYARTSDAGITVFLVRQTPEVSPRRKSTASWACAVKPPQNSHTTLRGVNGARISRAADYRAACVPN